MSKLTAKFGYVVEANVAGYFYNRLGLWASYGSAAEGYVWSEQEVLAISNKATQAATAWPLTPEKAHPAVYDDSFGITIITGAAESISALVSKTTSTGLSSNEEVPDGGGNKFDIKVFASKLGVNMLGNAMASL